MRSFQAGGRPAIVGAIASLADGLHLPVTAVATSLGPVLAVGVALAMAAFADLALGANRARFALVALFTGAFLSLLVPGYFSTLAFGAMLLAGLTSLASGMDQRGWMGTIAAGGLIGMAGLAQPLFLPLGLVLVTGGVAALVPSMRVGHTQRETSIGRTDAGKAVLASLGGIALTVAGVAAVGQQVRPAIDTSRDALLRRVGLGSSTRDSFERVLRRFFPLYRVFTVLGLSALFLLFGVRRRPGHPGPAVAPTDDGPGTAFKGGSPNRVRFFWGVMVGWLLLTVAGIVALFAGTTAPGQRLAAFCLALPLLSALGVLALRDRLRLTRPRWGAAATAGGVVLFVGVGWLFWAKQAPLMAPAGLRQMSVAGGYLAKQPPGTPLIVVVDDRSAESGFTAEPDINYLRDAVPPERIPDVHLFLGSPDDFLKGQPTLIGRPEHDAIALYAWSRIRPILSRHPVVVVLRGLDPGSYATVEARRAASSGPPTYRLADGVLTVPGYGGPAGQRGPITPEPGVGPVSPWLPLWLAPAMLAVLMAMGWPWVQGTIPEVRRLIRVAVMPAFGLAALGLSSMAVDGFGMRLSKAGGTVAIAAAFGVGAVVSMVRRRHLDRESIGRAPDERDASA